MNRIYTILTLLLVAVQLAIPGCPRDDRGNGRGPGWKLHEHGDPLQGYGPKNPSGRDLRHN